MVTLSPSILTGSRIASITSPAPTSVAVYAVSDHQVRFTIPQRQPHRISNHGSTGLRGINCCFHHGERRVAAHHTVTGGSQDTPEPALAAAHIDGQSARRRQQIKKLRQVEPPEVIIKLR